ncbi:hypothetical protein Tco_1428719 [Tanacetum coccineum]
MDDDLFTYEVKIPRLSCIPCVVQQVDDLDDGDLVIYEQRVCFDENKSVYAKAVYFIKDKLVRLIDVTLEQGYDEVVLTDEEIFDLEDENLIDENEIAEIFKIETDIFYFKTPLCKAFNELNYLLKVDTDLFTHDITGFKTYEEYKIELIHEWNRGITWVPKSHDGKLQEEALKQKSIYEGSWGDATRGVLRFCAWLKECFGNFYELGYELMIKLEEY